MTALCRMDWREVRKSSEESCVNLSSNWGSVLWGFTEREKICFQEIYFIRSKFRL